MEKFPYKFVMNEDGEEFLPPMIDFDNEEVWRQVGQASGNGEWIGMNEGKLIHLELEKLKKGFGLDGPDGNKLFKKKNQ